MRKSTFLLIGAPLLLSSCLGSVIGGNTGPTGLISDSNPTLPSEVSESSITSDQSSYIPVQSLFMTKRNFEMYIGDKDQLYVNVMPRDATNKGLNFFSTSPNVLLVDKDGNFEALSEGSSYIMITSKDNPSITNYASVTVIGERVTELEFITLPKTSYKVNESLDFDNLSVLARYQSGKTKELSPYDLEINNMGPFRYAITYTIVLSYGGCSLTYDIQVSE